jgi:hypothetical protein
MKALMRPKESSKNLAPTISTKVPYHLFNLNTGVIVNRDAMGGAIGGDALNDSAEVSNTNPLPYELMKQLR